MKIIITKFIHLCVVCVWVCVCVLLSCWRLTVQYLFTLSFAVDWSSRWLSRSNETKCMDIDGNLCSLAACGLFKYVNTPLRSRRMRVSDDASLTVFFFLFSFSAQITSVWRNRLFNVQFTVFFTNLISSHDLLDLDALPFRARPRCVRVIRVCVFRRR